MRTSADHREDPWRIEIIAVRAASHTSGERSALQRDVERGLLVRPGPGAHVDRIAFEAMPPEDQHIVRMRARTAATDAPVVFSHWSAAVLHGLPVQWQRLRTLHATFDEPSRRSGLGVTGHVFAFEEAEVVSFRGLLATGVGRTVVDLAGASAMEEGVAAADGALCAGVPREVLRAAVEVAGPRRAGRRIGDVIDFAHPGAESAAESRYRVTAFRIGLEVPVLQHGIRLVDGSRAFVDALHPAARVGVEVDGDRKYLDPDMAPLGAGRAVLAEKRREDEVRTHLASLVRVGWSQAGSTSLLRAALARVGVRPVRPRPSVLDHARMAAVARPRITARDPQWRQ